MNDMQHPLAQLSAYLDDALRSSERGAVDAHLAACADCRSRLAELRATAALIRALPELRPSRRLAPRIARPAWLAPLRTLSTLASGVSVFLFLATALLSNTSQFASISAPLGNSAAAPAPAGGAATAASGAPGAFSPFGPAADTTSRNAASGAPAPAVAAPTGTSSADAAKQAGGASASPGVQTQFSGASSPSAQERAGEPAGERVAQPSRSIFSMPVLWLALAVITAALAIALQRRLRSA